MNNSRLNRYEKRRRNTQTINILLFLAAALIIVLFLLFVFSKADGDHNKQAINSNQAEENNHHNNQENNNLNNEDEDKDQTETSPENANENTNNDVRENQSESSDNNDSENTGEIIALPIENENVISAFTKNWEPIGTEQEEPHVMQFKKESRDWEEMEQALKLATELDELIIWWLGNDGDQRAVGTVTSLDESEIYRVYISWVKHEGWQPTKVEVLLENDRAKKN